VPGLTLETGLLFLPAIVYLATTEARGTGAFLGLDGGTRLLVAAAGPITTLPLVLFAAAVQRIPLSAIGILQFIAPTIQFLLACWSTKSRSASSSSSASRSSGRR
jgi:chloramphenicol-sensitive protein RarD